MFSAISALTVVLLAGCGKKGPPLPPLVKLPVAPVDFTATRRGDTVDVRFTVPGSNTDNTRPANIKRVEVYAVTGLQPVNEDDWVKRGTKVASIAVKAPRNPDQTIEPDESVEDIEPLEGHGLDQGAAARAEERLTGESFSQTNAASTSFKGRRRAGDVPARPLLGMWMLPIPSRTYVGVGISKNGRKGPVTRPATVPLLQPPPAPDAPKVTWDENAVTVTWTPPLTSGGASAATQDDVLLSRLIGEPSPALSYHVYEVAPGSGSSRTLPETRSAPATGAPASVTPGSTTPGSATPGSVGSGLSRTSSETALTKTPIAETRFSDPRMTRGATRCYAVRAVRRVNALTIESDEQPPTCVTLKDTFAPAPPNKLTAVASEGAISLIWEPGNEKDLDGYLVLRGAVADDLKPITPAPIHETNFRDAVQPGVRYAYAVQAVDQAGNISLMSNRVEETAR